MTSVVGILPSSTQFASFWRSQAIGSRNIFRGYGSVQDSGTDAVLVDPSADYRGNEMMFERAAPSCYPRAPFSALLERGSSTGQVLDDMPAEDMHRAVSKVSLSYAEICGTAERIVASSPRELGHGKEADGMSAGG